MRPDKAQCIRDVSFHSFVLNRPRPPVTKEPGANQSLPPLRIVVRTTQKRAIHAGHGLGSIGLLLQCYSSGFRLGSQFKPADMASNGGACGEFGAVVTRAEVAVGMGPSVAVFHFPPPSFARIAICAASLRSTHTYCPSTIIWVIFGFVGFICVPFPPKRSTTLRFRRAGNRLDKASWHNHAVG